MTANLQGHDWDDVRVFLALLRARSLGQGAGRLGVDISTASRRLAALEARLGARLFERTREGLVPTRAAELVQAAAELMESAHARFIHDVAGLETVAEGVVRISATAGLSQDFLAPALPRLKARHPNLRLELDATNRPVDLVRRREADLALRTAPLEGAGLVATKLTTLRWIAAATPELAEDLAPLARWDDAPWIGWGDDMASLHVARWLDRHVSRDRVWVRSSAFPAQLAAARSGVGVVLAPEQQVRRIGLVPLAVAPALRPGAEAWPVDDLWLIAHRAVRDVPRVAAVWTFLVEEFREGGPPHSRPRAARKASRAR